jgi:hypothetical protein
MDVNTIRLALTEVGEQLRAEGLTAEIAVFGGAAIALCYGFREFTKDVDAVVSSGDKKRVFEIAEKVAETMSLPGDWLNDAVKGFLSAQGVFQHVGQFPSDGKIGGLILSTPTAEYLLAMKCLAMRVDSHDLEDILKLIPYTSIRTTEDLMNLVESFYPKKMIPSKVKFGIEELMDRFNEQP